MTFFAGLMLGLVGSVHCAVMCGPLAALGAAHGPRRSRADAAAGVALYQVGRLGVYLILGAIMAAAGDLLARSGFSRALSASAGVVLLWSALVAWRPRFQTTGTVSRALSAVPGRAAAWLRGHRWSGPFAAGIVNGLLPCGLLYAALVAAAGLGQIGASLSFMIGFGAGTTPVMAAIGLAAAGGRAVAPRRLRRLAPAAMALTGVLLVTRAVQPHPMHGASHDHTMTSAPGAMPDMR